MSFDYFSKRRMQYILEKLKTIFDTKADISDVPDAFADLTDVTISNPVTSQVPVYNSTTGEWKNGRKIIFSTSDPEVNVGDNFDTYIKVSSNDYGKSFRIYTTSTSGERASIAIETIISGVVTNTDSVSFRSPSRTYSDFTTTYSGGNWRVNITTNNISGYTQGEQIAWAYYANQNLNLVINPPTVYATYIKSNGIWIRCKDTPISTFADLTDTAFANLQNGQVAIYNSTTGKWENQNLPSSTDLFTITLTSSEDPETGETIYTANKLPSEVIAAYNNGDVVQLVMSSGNLPYYFTLGNAVISEDESESETGFMFQRLFVYDNDEAAFGEFILVKEQNVDAWDYIEFIHNFLAVGGNSLVAEITENNNVYTCDKTFEEVNDAYYGSKDIFIKFGSRIFKISRYESSTDTFYFTSTIANANSIDVKTFVMTGSYITEDWTSISLVESSGDPNAIRWEEAETSVKKNWLPVALNTKTANGVTYTVNSDKTITVNGTCTTSINTYINEFIRLPEGNYIISGVPDGTNANANLWIGLYDGSSYSSAQRLRADTGKYTWAFTVTSSIKYVSVRIDIDKDFVADSLVFKPMIRLASTEDNTYVPYIPDNTELVDWKNNGVLGAKNFINNTLVTQTKNGVTFTVNSDKSITVSGTASAELDASVEISRFIIQPGTYRLSALPTNVDGGGSKIRCWVSANGSWIDWTDDGANSVESKLVHTFTTPTDVRVNAVVYKGKSYSTTFRPMIRLIDDSDSTYQPYAKTNQILTEDVLQKVDWTGASTSVKKNLIPNNAVSQTINGVTFTVNSDGSVLVNGTNTASDWATTFEISTTLLKTGEYYLSQSYVSEGAIIFLRLRVNNSMGAAIKELGNKSQDTFSLSNDTNVYCDIQIRPNGVVNNVVIKPMVRLASIENDTYVPYIPDNTELVSWSGSNKSVKKNFLNLTCTSTTIVGVTFTVNMDKTVTVNGTRTSAGESKFYFYNKNSLFLVAGETYIASIGHKNESSNITELVIKFYNDDTVVGQFQINTYKEDVTFTVPSNANQVECYYYFAGNGTSIDNVTLKPMIRLASVQDSTYAPYVPDNTELLSYVDNNVLGAKNLFNLDVFSLSTNGSGVSRTKSDNLIEVTCSVKDSGVYINNGQLRSAFSFITEPCIFSFECKASVEGLVKVCPEYSGLTYYTVGTNWSYYEYTITDTSSMPAFIIYDGENVSKTISVRNFMLRLATDTDNTYQPYAMTNRQLTELAPVWTSSVSALTGATSVTITDANIHTTSVIEPFADNGTNTAMSMPTMTVTEGQCVLGFDALTADTTFKLRISN